MPPALGKQPGGVPDTHCGGIEMQTVTQAYNLTPTEVETIESALLRQRNDGAYPLGVEPPRWCGAVTR